MSRKTFLKALAGAATLGGFARSGQAAPPRLRMPAEWEQHERCVMAFCAAWDVYGDADVEAIRFEQARIAKAIAGFEPVTMLVNPEDTDAARVLCGPTVEIVTGWHDDVWTRDTLPTIVRDEAGKRHAIGWNFNAWGEKFEQGYARDRDLAERFARLNDLPFEASRLVMEGGSIETDGAGLAITTETAVLNANRNPGINKAAVEAEWTRLLGASKVVWLAGSRVDRITEGHVDGVVKFLAPGQLVVEVTDDPEDPEYEELQDNQARLRGLTDATGRPVTLHELLRPRYDRIGERGEDFAGAYVNAYIANGGVVLPKFGDRVRDEAARELFTRLSGRPALSVAVDTIVEMGGGIHCNTQQIPA